jgi:hypothetical protein
MSRKQLSIEEIERVRCGEGTNNQLVSIESSTKTNYPLGMVGLGRIGSG